MSQTDRQQLSNVFIWGDVGEELKKIDAKRHLAVAQLDPNHHLSLVANEEISNIVNALKKSEGKLNKDIIEMIIQSNNLDNQFREISKFFRYNPDMLSIGSFITGHKARQGGVADILD